MLCQFSEAIAFPLGLQLLQTRVIDQAERMTCFMDLHVTLEQGCSALLVTVSKFKTALLENGYSGFCSLFLFSFFYLFSFAFYYHYYIEKQ